MTATINGATRLYAIIGDPIVQVRSPELYTELFAAAGMNAVMVPMHVFPDRFDETVPALHGARQSRRTGRDGAVQGARGALCCEAREDGCPHRRPRMRFAAKRTGRGQATCSTARASCAPRSARGVSLRGRRVALFGAGGAGSAIGCELAAAGVAIACRSSIRSSERAAALAKTLGEAFPACRVAAADTVCRTTST